jgi:hypothetical protein
MALLPRVRDGVLTVDLLPAELHGRHELLAGDRSRPW